MVPATYEGLDYTSPVRSIPMYSFDILRVSHAFTRKGWEWPLEHFEHLETGCTPHLLRHLLVPLPEALNELLQVSHLPTSQQCLNIKLDAEIIHVQKCAKIAWPFFAAVGRLPGVRFSTSKSDLPFGSTAWLRMGFPVRPQQFPNNLI